MLGSRTRSRKMKYSLIAFAFGLCLASLPRPARASNDCPWLNEATASGYLGGDAVGAFKGTSAGGPATCTFTQHGEQVTRTLTITVEIVSNPHERFSSIAQSCGAASEPLHAIGNEALSCAMDNRHGASEQAVGRVRDQVFSITIHTTAKDDPVLTRDALKSRIYSASEQVAGNLF
jgi:hypothetical protein